MNLRKTRRLLAAVRVMVSVGAALGFERRDQRGDRQTQPRDHLRQHVIGEKAQAIGHQLHGNVPIAEVIGGFGDQKRVAGDRFEAAFLFQQSWECSTQLVD